MKIKLVNLLRLPIYLILTAVLAVLPACNDGSVNPLDFNAFSLQDDVALGKQLDDQIKADPNEYPLLNDPYVQQYMNNIMAQILQSPDIKFKNDFPYQIKVINTDVINAFAAPGGYVYVYKGLLKFIDNEATLAAVVAHEIGHCENRHATKRITKAYGIKFLLDLLLGDNPDQLTALGAEILTNFTLLQNSQSDEYEADQSSFYYLMSTKWYPGATIFFFDKIKDQSGTPNIFEQLFSTHPMPEDRIQKVEELIKNNNIPAPTESNLFPTEYADFKTHLN